MVQGKNITILMASSVYAAIDTGPTLVGGPSNAIQNIHARIPRSGPGAGSWEVLLLLCIFRRHLLWESQLSH